MRIALAQLNTTVGDLRGNAGKILDAYRRAAAQGAQVVLTPELAVTGYPPRDLLAKQRFVDDNLRTLEELARATGDAALVAGYVERNPQRPGRAHYNALAVLRHGRIVERRFKTLLPTYDVFDEDRYFQPAVSNEPVTMDGHRVGLTICEDIWNVAQDFSPKIYRRDPVAEFGTIDTIFNISASPYHLGKEQTRLELLRTVARQRRIPLAYCNLVGGNDDLIFDGNSLVLDAAGNVIAHGAAFCEDLVIVELGNASPIPYPTRPTVQSLHDALVLGLRDYVHKCGFRSVVIGLSGGIDSAVTACLAVAALGSENVMGVSLPSEFSSSGSLEDARELAGNLGIRYEVISIQETFEALRRTLREIFRGWPSDTTEENMQARIRGTILMALSNKFGHMLLTTGNKSELAVGYCTLYGDMNGGLGVIADVPKTMVYELARFLNRDRQRIPAACLTKPPSAELRPHQTDQDSLPPYDVLDAILKRYVEESKSAADIVTETGYDPQLVRDIVRKIDLNEYKRRQAPPVLRVTTKAFGVGRRVPIAQRYVER